MLTDKEREEIELSISFGQRLMLYYKATLDKILSSSLDMSQTIQQNYDSDRLYICDIIQALETGEHINSLYNIKRRLTIVGQQFFKKEFTALKSLY